MGRIIRACRLLRLGLRSQGFLCIIFKVFRRLVLKGIYLVNKRNHELKIFRVSFLRLLKRNNSLES